MNARPQPAASSQVVEEENDAMADLLSDKVRKLKSVSYAIYVFFS